MDTWLNSLRRTWNGDRSLLGFAGIYILANLVMAVLSMAVLIVGLKGALGTGLLISIGLIVGSAVACSGLIGAVVFARGLWVKQGYLSGLSKLLAWLLLIPHSAIALAAATAFVFLGVGTIGMLWELWFGEAL